MVSEQGATHVLDHGAPDYVEAVGRLTGGRGPEIVLEMLANVNLPKDLALVAAGGRIVIIGSRGSVEINPRDIMVRGAVVTGMVLFLASAEELTSTHAALGEGLRTGALRPIVREEVPLAEAPRAHHDVMETRAYGKIVLATW